jgi:hypothetical protein
MRSPGCCAGKRAALPATPCRSRAADWQRHRTRDHPAPPRRLTGADGQADLRRRSTNPIAARPAPSKAIEAGSGTTLFNAWAVLLLNVRPDRKAGSSESSCSISKPAI